MSFVALGREKKRNTQQKSVLNSGNFAFFLKVFFVLLQISPEKPIRKKGCFRCPKFFGQRRANATALAQRWCPIFDRIHHLYFSHRVYFSCISLPVRSRSGGDLIGQTVFPVAKCWQDKRKSIHVVILRVQTKWSTSPYSGPCWKCFKSQSSRSAKNNTVRARNL